MSKTLSTKKALVVFLAAIALALAGLACAPATASASELTAGKMAQSVKSPAFRIAKDAPPTVDAHIASGAGKISVHASTVNYAEGYEFQVSPSANFSKGVKTKRVKTASTMVYGTTFKGLKKGKKYYVRARAYQTSTNLCTKWSKKKSAKTGIAYGKSKITGKWRVISTNNSYANNEIALGNRYGKYITVTFGKNGKITLKKFDNPQKSITPWVATGKNKGFGFSSYTKTSTASIKSGVLTLKETASGLQMRLKRA